MDRGGDQAPMPHDSGDAMHCPVSELRARRAVFRADATGRRSRQIGRQSIQRPGRPETPDVAECRDAFGEHVAASRPIVGDAQDPRPALSEVVPAIHGLPGGKPRNCVSGRHHHSRQQCIVQASPKRTPIHPGSNPVARQQCIVGPVESVESPCPDHCRACESTNGDYPMPTIADNGTRPHPTDMGMGGDRTRLQGPSIPKQCIV